MRKIIQEDMFPIFYTVGLDSAYHYFIHIVGSRLKLFASIQTKSIPLDSNFWSLVVL